MICRIQKVVHLDLKPENIICCQPESSEVKIIDFGLARIIKPGEEVKVISRSAENYLKVDGHFAIHATA